MASKLLLEITTDSTDKTKNKISLKRNLGRDANTKDKAVLKADEDKSALVIGGRVNQGDATGGQTTEKDYGALGQDSVTVGGADNTASGDAAVVVGGLSNTSSAQYSTVVGGSANDAIGNESSVFGGFNNDATGLYATISGGSYNRTYGEAASVFGGSMNNAVGSTSSVFGGSINTANGIWSSVVGGSHNTTLGLSSTAVGGENAIVDGKNSVGIAGGSTKADNALAAGNEATVTVNNGTAIGYQATANKEGTVAFGHDKDDVYYTSTWPQKATEKDGKYYDADNKEITEAQYEALRNADTTFNDYSQKPTVTENKYGSAAYNRLVKVADGQDVHDVVVMEQLDKAKTELTKDLSVNAGWGINVADVTTKNNDGTETTTKNVISLNRNLGTNYGNPWKGEGKVTFEAGGENSLILGGAASILFHNEADDVKAGAYGKDSVLVGGFNNLIDTVVNDATQTGEYAVIVGGDTNEVTGQKSVSVGGYKNTVTGRQSVINGGASNIASGAASSVFGGQQNTASGLYASVFGGDQNEASEEWSSAIGGITNTASGIHAVTLGGENNVAEGQKATTVGGTQNMAIGEWSLAAGGAENTSYGDAAYTAGGTHNMAYGNDSVALGGVKSNVNAKASTGIAGGSTGEKAITALAAGYQSVVTDSGVEWHTATQADLDAKNQGLPWSGFTYTEDHDPYTTYVLDKISTAVGYQSTADAPGVIAFGHDKGDVASVAKKWKQKATMEVGDDYSAKFYDANHNEISSDEYYKLANADGTWNDYTQAPIGTEEKTYQSAYYNRLVKAADGIDAHDAVVMEQLTPYTKSNASNIGSNLKTYTVGDDGETITESDATEEQQKANKDAWGQALGAGTFTTGTDTTPTNASASDQLVTGKTLYDYDKPTGSTNYVKVNNTTGQNLSALDAQVKANADTLNDSTHNIKYYSVNGENLPGFGQADTFSNAGNKGAVGRGSLAAGAYTYTAGLASTVAGSYSGIYNKGTVSGTDFRGAAALSLGTVNINRNMDTTKPYSGVANSLIGQANVTTDSNAAIILGAGNTVKDSYRTISNLNLSGDMTAALKEAVPGSGGQVMVMGGGNSVDKAYMTQVTGVGNTVTGADSTYTEGTSTQYNFVDGFQNELTNGKHDYIIGSNNKVSGDSVDKNQSNIIFGDNHKLTDQKNNVIIGSSDTADDETTVSDIVAIGHNAKVSAEGGVAIGSGSVVAASTEKVSGYDPTTKTQSKDKTSHVWNATTGAVSIGTADGTVTRQINGLAAGTKDTDAVNVAQLKKLGDNTVQYDLNTNKGKITLAGQQGTTITNVKSALDGAKDADGKDATIATATGDALKNAANLGDLQKVYNDVNAKADKASASHTALTVEGGKAAGTEDGSYTGDNILLHATTDKETGKVTYDLKLNNDIMIGNKGKDGVSITGPQGEAGKDGIDGKVGISGKDGKDAVSITGKDGVGHIGLTGPKGADGTPGASIDITVKNGYNEQGKDGKDGINGEKGVDGNNLTRVVYTDKTGEHQIATMEDGLKFKGDDKTVISKKLNNTLEIIGGADSKKLTEGNIGVNSTEDGKLKVQLAQDLTKITSISNQTTTGEGEQAKTTGVKIDLGEDGNISVNNGKITDVGDGSISHSSKDAINGETLYNEVRPTKGKYVSVGKTTAQNLTSLDEQIQSNEAQITNMDNRSVKYDMSADNQSVDKTKITLAGEGGTTITNVKSALDGVKDEKGNPIAIDKVTGEVLTNAVNLGDLQKVYNDVNSKAENASASHTVLTVEGGKAAGTGKDVYNGENILLNATTDEKTGKVTYDLKLNNDIMIGNKGKDGVSITGPQGKDGEAGKDGIDGKVGISGKDGKDAVSITGKDGVGHIGLTGPAGTNGMKGADGQPGTSIDITVKNGYDGANGINGKNGVDGTSLTRIVYTDKTGEHQVATLEDGLKFKGDDETVIAKKLNNTLEIIGGAKGDLTEGNIGVNSTKDGKLKVQLAKDLKGITSISNQTTTKVDGKDVTTGAKITLGDDGSVDVNGGKITNVGSGADASGNYTTKTNAANIGDVQKIVKDAVNSASDTTNKALAGKANIDASNIGANLKDANGKAASTEDQKTNAEEWGSAIGTGKIEANDGRMVTGKTVYDEVRPKNDGSYVKKNQTTGENLSALDSKIGKLDETKKYNYIDSGKDVSISDNLTKLDTQVKNNATDIQNITNNVQNLSDNAVQYDKDTNKTKVTLGGGKDGTTITNVKDGALNDNSTDAVNGRQLNAVQKQVTNNTNEITKIKNGDFTDTSKTVIKNLAKDAVQVKAGDRIKVYEATDEKTGNKTYTISANNNGTVAKGDGNLISGDTLYKEVHVDNDGSYIRSGNTVGQNLSALDSGLKTTSDLIHTNTKGDTIQIGGNSTTTKIDVSGKDKDGNTTGRVITGIMTEGKDLTSAANVGYVNGITSANTQQIYRDMNNAYSRLDTNINRAAAGSNALAALHPLDFDPADKASFAVGYGHYHNANAAAIGAFYQPNANTMVNMGISLGNGDPGFNAGVSFKLGKGSAYNGVSKAEMAQTIHDQAEEISAIKANDAAKDKRIDALEKENQEMKKQIQEILSRLNG